MLTQLNQALSSRYEVEREIGAGGMALVFLARDVRHDRRVALKVLRPELGAILGVDRFLAEIKVTANLQHPNLLPLFDSGNADGHLFYVMPFVEGESLRARLDREGQLSVDEAIRIAVAIAAALQYAHEQGVIHRDLKPDNVLLQAGQPVISDFGIALAVSNAGGTRITQTGLSLGTPQYMSPEQATGDRLVDARADIYSLAAMTYEMLTGEPPHSGTNAQTIIARVITEQPRPVRSSRPNAPEHVEFAVERGLAKLAADRWSSAREFAEAIQGKTVVDGSVSRSGDKASRSFSHRLRRELANPFMLGLAAVAVASSLTAAWQWNGSRPETPAPTTRFQIAPTRRVSMTVTQGASVSISPDGGTVAFVARVAAMRNQLFVRRPGNLEPEPLADTEGSGVPFFSPDGQWLGFLANSKVRKVSLSTGAVVDIADVGGLPSGVAWVTPGQIVLSLGSELLVQPSAGGPRDTLPRAPGEVAREWPRALGDGEHVLYASWPESGGLLTARIAVTSVRTGKTSILDAIGVCPLGVVDGMLLYVTANQDVMAAPFDKRSLRVTGDPTPVERGVLLGARGSCKAAVSLNGTLVVQRGLPQAQLVARDERGVERMVLGDTKAYAHPRYSPDGKRIAVTIAAGPRSDVWIHDIAGGTLSRLTDKGTTNERPEWSPDGTRVLYRSDRGPRSGIWWQPVDKSDSAKPLVLFSRADVFEATMSPDGLGVLYQVDTAGADVMYRRLQGDTLPRAVASSPFAEDRARISPDGKWVALTLSSNGPQVVVHALDGTGGQVQVSTGPGSEPVWSRTGNRLFYRDGLKFIAATWEANPRFRIVTRTVLFDDQYVVTPQPHAGYDVSADGSTFLLLKMVESSEVIVVQNLLTQTRAAAGRQR